MVIQIFAQNWIGKTFNYSMQICKDVPQLKVFGVKSELLQGSLNSYPLSLLELVPSLPLHSSLFKLLYFFFLPRKTFSMFRINIMDFFYLY